jgi:hypothetical protein
MKHNPGIGATPDLSLRVSVATLVRVIFKHPGNTEWMLALECQATLHEKKVEVKTKPFGGAIRILDVEAIHDLIGDFHFDSVRSRTEQDFRLFIRPSSWPVLREFCIECLNRDNDPILETDPKRELVEEFTDTLKISLQPDQYTIKPVATFVENEATPTENIHAQGSHTVRVYRIFEATITNSALAHAMLINSERSSYKHMCEFALEDARTGGKGRANAVFAFPLKAITDTYLAPSLKERSSPTFFEGTRFDETVPVVLEGITVLKYHKR